MKIDRRWEGAHHPSSKEEGKALGEDSAKVMNGVKRLLLLLLLLLRRLHKVDGIVEGRRDWRGAGKGNEGGTVQG